MNCEDCLRALKTESLRDISPDSPIMRHCARCPDCARVTTMLRDREYETATVLNNLPPISNPLTVAGTAVHTAQRRRIGRVVVTLSGVAGAIIIWIVAATMIVLPMQRAGIISDNDRQSPKSVLRAETMTLSCLSPQQAAEIVGPYFSSAGSIISVPPSGISAITVRGTAHELAQARDLVREFEKNPGAACRAPATTVGQPSQIFEYAPHAGTSLLNPPANRAPSLLDPKAGSAPVLAPGTATTPPKKD